MPIRVELLGRPRILSDDGRPIEFPLGKPLALLSYLLVEGNPVPRTDLAEILWPNASREKARQSTRQAIWHLRRTLGDDTLLGSDDITVSVEHVQSDIGEFRAALSEGAIDRARRLWRGPLCASLTLTNCRTWDRWIEERRDEIDDGFFRGLLEAGESLREAGNPAEASAYLQEAITQRPESIEAWRHYVEALLDLGNAREAEAALREMTRRAMEEDDGPDVLSPLLKRLEKVRATASHPIDGDRITDHMEFVGRSEELATLRAAWRRTGIGGMGLVSVLGPTGIGKTRLCQEIVAYAETNNGHTAMARGFESEAGIPHGTAADLVGSLLDLPGAAGISSASDLLLRSIVPSKNGRRAGQEEGVPIHPAALADALADLVEAVSFEAPLIVWIDDYQWVDEESRAAFSKIVRRLDRVPCLFLFAERTRVGGGTAGSGLRDTLGPETKAKRGPRRDARNPVAESLAIALDGKRIRLAPLSLEETGEMIGLLADFSVPDAADDVVARIHRATDGNPFFVAELLRHFAHEGICEFEDRGWTLWTERVPLDLELPESVRTLLEARLDRVPERAEPLLYELAMAGRGLSAHALQARTKLTDDVISEIVATLENEEILRWTRARNLDFTHDQLRAAAKDRYQPEAEEGLGAEGDGRRRWGWIVGGVAGLAAAAIILSLGLGPIPPFPWIEEEPPTWPFGQGSILVFDDEADTAVVVRPPAREGEPWTTQRYAGWVPQDQMWSNLTPFPTRDQGLGWLAAVSRSEEGPWVSFVGPGGESAPVFRTAGDDGVRDAWTDGTEVLISAENLETEADTLYDNDLLLFPALPVNQTTSATVLYRSQSILGPVRWSPFADRVGFIVKGAIDTLIVVHPDGSLFLKRPSPEYRSLQALSWCSDGETLLTGGYDLEGAPYALLDLRSGDMRPAGELRFPLSQPLCLGHGRGAAIVTAVDQRRTLAVLDFESGDTIPFPAVPAGAGLEYFWLPDVKPRPVRALSIEGGRRTLAWGGRDTLRLARWDGRGPSAEGRGFDDMSGEGATGRPDAQGFQSGSTSFVHPEGALDSHGRILRDLKWRTSAPGVAAVSDDGTVIGTGPGEAWVFAESGGWLKDSVLIRVMDEGPGPEEVLFREALDDPLLGQWFIDSTIVHPPPTIRQFDGSSVLALNGDGQYRDFFFTNQRFSLNQGVTLETEFRLPLTDRTNDQRFQICLSELPESGEFDPLARHPTHNRICFLYPSGELVKFRPDLARISVGHLDPPMEVSVEPGLPGSDWVHLALQVRADGAASVFLNGEELHRSQNPLVLSPQKEWKIDLSGFSVDTELFVRNLVLWRGERY